MFIALACTVSLVGMSTSMSTSWTCSDLRASSPLSLRMHDCIMSTVDMMLASTALVNSMSIDMFSVALGSILCWV
jgi:hypothetical protein